MSKPQIEHMMTEEEQASVWAEVSAHSQEMGPKSKALIARTQTISLTVDGSTLMRAMPDYMEISVTAEKNAGGNGYHVSTFSFDADLADIYEEVNEKVFKERLARYVMEHCEDIFLSGEGLNWRE